jgi:hypothetical protein
MALDLESHLKVEDTPDGVNGNLARLYKLIPWIGNTAVGHCSKVLWNRSYRYWAKTVQIIRLLAVHLCHESDVSQYVASDPSDCTQLPCNATTG